MDNQLAEDIANYVETHNNYANMTKREAVIEAIRVLTDDPGAIRQYLDAIGWSERPPAQEM